ncbi:enoyl-CoA hydratase/isomerase family protein [Hoeflea sp. WL0058]|uniref:Enoyl-CoA hydratase/isomerase family protein n=1 Tax=Flavimaribacter sediminis TaxID=2865987 RepID=A0AAE3D1S1_9HYPH|nr:enoyl-CoA hydratase-related protein [Flavimaribacter sediminis]MBW8639189.1 enoyl-CoA hydratase/isomerase family protein [Flavimaribacter sediminis]
MADPVLLSVDGHVLTITLNRPEQLNALSRKAMTFFEKTVRALGDFSGVRAVIITGAGRAFCAGGDLIGFKRAIDVDKQALLDELAYNQTILQMIEDIPVPVIGAANGVAAAGGLELLLCCDIVLAAKNAKIGDGHARYAIVPAGGATVRLPRKIGPANAARLFYTAELVDAETMRDWGLVSEVVPGDKLLERAQALASDIARGSPEVLRRIKKLISARAGEPVTGLAEIGQFAEHVNGADLDEGLRAFIEKRTPDY